jgi:hypothetical protein
VTSEAAYGVYDKAGPDKDEHYQLVRGDGLVHKQEPAEEGYCGSGVLEDAHGLEGYLVYTML